MTGAAITGGCLCGALRFAAEGAPELAGLCFCSDCRKASGGGFVGFMGYPAERVRISGEARQYRSPSFRGTEAVRNFCAVCGGLVFGGVYGEDVSHTLYAGALDDPAVFVPTIALFDRDRPAWAALPPGLTIYATMPG